MYHIPMKNDTLFRKKVKENRKRISESGIPMATVNAWAYGKRRPLYETALKIAPILGLKISEIPYYMIVRNL